MSVTRLCVPSSRRATPREFDARLTSRIRNMVAFLTAADDVEELKIPPNFGFHRLEGDRAGTCAMTLTPNWRLTFRVTERRSIVEIHLEDYH